MMANWYFQCFLLSDILIAQRERNQVISTNKCYELLKQMPSHCLQMIKVKKNIVMRGT